MAFLLVKWVSERNKIHAIRCCRHVFDMPLKQARDLICDPTDAGFIVTPLQWLALRGLYMMQNNAHTQLTDWQIEKYTTPHLPVDLTVNEPCDAHTAPDYPARVVREYFDGSCTVDGPTIKGAAEGDATLGEILSEFVADGED